MSKRPYKQFFHGKNIPKSNYGQKPLRWIPGTYLDTYHSETGQFRSRRKYGSDGYAYKDMDTADMHRPYDHVHDFVDRKRASVPRNPTKAERREFTKAKRKRRFF